MRRPMHPATHVAMVMIGGRASALLEVGAGFNPEFSELDSV